MNETQKMIKAYQAALPHLRERVVAVALLLAMSVSMLTTASFAWLTISRAPAVVGVNTTVAANGNLEIALVNPEGTVPEESKVGDSTAAGNSVTAANLTWGNLVNLSDPSYGLEYITLRPALLGDSNRLLTTPLIGVNYGQDGRVQQGYNMDFGFTNWNAERGFFEYSNTETRYGVRAVSTIEYKVQDSTTQVYRDLEKEARNKNQESRDIYRAIIGPDTPANNNPSNHNANIKAIAGLLGDYMSAQIAGNEATLNCAGYVDELYGMLVEFQRGYYVAGESLAALANMQVFNKYGVSDYKNHLYTEEDLWDGEKIAADGVKLDALTQYKKDVTLLEQLMAGWTDSKGEHKGMQYYYDLINDGNTSNDTVYWPEMEALVNNIVEISSCTVAANANATPVAVGNMGMSAAFDLLGTTPYAVMKKGIIVNYEQLTGERMNMHSVKVTAKVYGISQSLTAASITTAAKGASGFENDLNNHSLMDMGSNLEGSAEDTYGMVVDLWARTNAANSYLKLEGLVEQEEYYVPATMTIPGGATVDLYAATVSHPEDETQGDDPLGGILGNKENVDVYQLEGVWYFADTHARVWNEDDNGNEVLTRGESIEIADEQKIETRYRVIGYEGENRVWEDWKDLEDIGELSPQNTTQGKGSCYMFYADSPTDQENGLRLLSNLRVAFLDAHGTLIAKAKLDTTKPFEESGKVTVPLVLMEDGDSEHYTRVGDDLAITAMSQNVATRLTMIVYLDGTSLTNDQVLAANEIQGKLNVQFGTTSGMETIGDDELQKEEWEVTASVTGDTHDFDDATDNLTSGVEVKISGVTPSIVKAFFVRQISPTQGSREDTMTFTNQGNGTWTSSYTFKSPGTYILRSVELDGQEYDLTERPVVTVTGFASEVDCEGAEAGTITSILTGDRSYTTDVTVSFNATLKDRLPQKVQVQFVETETQKTVTAVLKKTIVAGEEKWVGSANFTTSGTYVMTYLITDNNFDELPAEKQCTLDLTLGVSATIYDDQSERDYLADGTSYPVNLSVKVEDDAGGELAGLQSVELNYAKDGSSVEGLDTDLTWDASKQRYTGNFELVKAGVFRFSNLTVGNSVITNIKGTAPSYRMIPPDPPQYVAGQDSFEPYVFLTNASGSVSMRMRLKYVDTATITGVFVNENGTEISVIGSPDFDENDETLCDVTFTLNQSVTNNGLDATWTLKELRLAGVYDKELNSYTEENPMVWTRDDVLADMAAMSTKVDIMKVTLFSVPTSTYGVDASGKVTGTFLQSFPVEGTFGIKITDQAGNQLADANGKVLGIDNVFLHYDYLGDPKDHGGYTNGTVGLNKYADGSNAHFELKLSQAENSKVDYAITPGNAMTLKNAGTYQPATLYFYLTDEDGETSTYYYGKQTYVTGQGVANSLGDINALKSNDNKTMPNLTVKTLAPVAKITTGTTNGTYNTKVVVKSRDWKGTPTMEASESKTSSYTDYTATLYAEGVADNDSLRHHGTYTEPKLALIVSGMNGGKATLTLPSKTSGVSEITYECSENVAVAKTLGTTTSANAGTGLAQYTGHTIETYYGQGTVEVTTITVVKGTATYTVTLANKLQITNPSST